MNLKRPNFLVIVTDQQTATLMSCAGNPHLSTPNMDRIAAAGTRFARAYCTNPVCLPSRISLMTGRMGSAMGVRSDSGHPNGTHIPETMLHAGFGWRLKEAGYRCLFGGKANWLRGMNAAQLGFEDLGRACRDDLADLCVDFLGQPQAQPFCLCTAFVNPHDICFYTIDACHNDERDRFLQHCPSEFATVRELAQPPAGVSEEEFAAMLPPLPANYAPQQDEPGAVAALLDERPFRRYAREHWTDHQWRLHRWIYHRLAERVDAEIGRVLAALDANGLTENTVVVLTSDHGDFDASHRLEHKSLFYEEAAHIPLLLSWPGHTVPAQVDHTHLASNGLDLTPTLCDFAGLPVDPDLPGRSLRPLAEGKEPAAWRTHLHIESEAGQLLHFGDAKYLRYDSGVHAEQFADLIADPGETRNHLDHPAVPQARALAESIWPRTR